MLKWKKIRITTPSYTDIKASCWCNLCKSKTTKINKQTKININMPNLYDKNSITKTFPISIGMFFSWHTNKMCVSLVYSIILGFFYPKHTLCVVLEGDKQKRVKM